MIKQQDFSSPCNINNYDDIENGRSWPGSFFNSQSPQLLVILPFLSPYTLFVFLFLSTCTLHLFYFSFLTTWRDFVKCRNKTKQTETTKVYHDNVIESNMPGSQKWNICDNISLSNEYTFLLHTSSVWRWTSRDKRTKDKSSNRCLTQP